PLSKGRDVKFFRAACIVAVAASLSTPSALASEHIAFTTVDGLIQVHASLAGGPAVPLLVDLGAGIDVLSAETARSLNLTANGRYTNWRMSGERVDIATTTLSSIALGGFVVDHPTVGVWKGLDGSGFAGLISATAFRDVAVTFDFVSHELIVEDPASMKAIERDRVRVPLAFADDRGISLDLFAPFDFGNGANGACEIDTGSQGYFIDTRLAAKIGVTPAAKPNDPKKRLEALIPFVRLVGAPASQRTAPTAIFTDLIFDCNVGNEFWAGRRFTLDIPDRSLFV
ncbi:MAG TPA: aspartyl protease family protein, partial [Candidatus Tumulicola sp.]